MHVCFVCRFLFVVVFISFGSCVLVLYSSYLFIPIVLCCFYGFYVLVRCFISPVVSHGVCFPVLIDFVRDTWYVLMFWSRPFFHVCFGRCNYYAIHWFRHVGYMAILILVRMSSVSSNMVGCVCLLHKQSLDGLGRFVLSLLFVLGSVSSLVLPCSIFEYVQFV